MRGMKGPCSESRLGGAINCQWACCTCDLAGGLPCGIAGMNPQSPADKLLLSPPLGPCRRRAGTAPPPPEVLRRYQQRPVAAIAEGHNVIHVAPTGSGKTAVAVAATLHMLQQDHRARIVFLAPSVALAEQQAGACKLGGNATVRTAGLNVCSQCVLSLVD